MKVNKINFFTMQYKIKLIQSKYTFKNSDKWVVVNFPKMLVEVPTTVGYGLLGQDLSGNLIRM